MVQQDEVQLSDVHYGTARYFEVEEFPDYERRYAVKDVEEYTPREVGIEGELLAAHFLERHGFEVLEQNWRCPWGEADIVASDDDGVVLVEVKTRIDHGNGYRLVPEEAVTEAKLRRYKKLSLAYLVDHLGLDTVRFDVIGVTIANDLASVHHVGNAFVWED